MDEIKIWRCDSMDSPQTGTVGVELPFFGAEHSIRAFQLPNVRR